MKFRVILNGICFCTLIVLSYADAEQLKTDFMRLKSDDNNAEGIAGIAVSQSQNISKRTLAAFDTKNIGFPYTMPLDFDRTVTLRWNFDSDNIMLQFIAPTTGWIGIGFSNTPSMIGADLIIAGVQFGETYVLDSYAKENGIPTLDKSQDVLIKSGWENGTHTSVTVTRKRITCDDNDMEINEGTFRVIWAYGENDINSQEISWNAYHQRNRGAKSLKLINPVVKTDEKEREELKYFDIRPIGFKVPKQETYYLCKYFELPRFTKKHHIVKMEPYLTKGNEKNVHHMIIRLCEKSGAILQEPRPLINGTCYVDFHPYLAGCLKMLAGFAIGWTGTKYPNNAGFPIGGVNDYRFVMMETHYNNPNLEDIIDSSGMRFHYTENLREHDIGILSLAHQNQGIMIPPKAENFKVNGYCSETCLKMGLERSNLREITVVGVVLHAHLAGTFLKLHHNRNGSAIRPIAVEEYYDNEYQETQYIENGKVKLKTGDSLKLECGYNTIDRKNITPGGYSAREEMCNSFLTYYPAINLDVCSSWGKFFGDSRAVERLVRNLNVAISPEELNMTVARLKESSNTGMATLAPILNRMTYCTT